MRGMVHFHECQHVSNILVEKIPFRHGDGCYGRSTVVSDLDGWGCPECLMAEVGKRAGLYRSPYNGAMDKHTRGECVSSTEEDRKEGTLQSIPTKEDEVQGLYKVCTREDV
jgi:hypothetical protein